MLVSFDIRLLTVSKLAMPVYCFLGCFGCYLDAAEFSLSVFDSLDIKRHPEVFQAGRGVKPKFLLQIVLYVPSM